MQLLVFVLQSLKSKRKLPHQLIDLRAVHLCARPDVAVMVHQEGRKASSPLEVARCPGAYMSVQGRAQPPRVAGIGALLAWLPPSPVVCRVRESTEPAAYCHLTSTDGFKIVMSCVCLRIDSFVCG